VIAGCFGSVKGSTVRSTEAAETCPALGFGLDLSQPNTEIRRVSTNMKMQFVKRLIVFSDQAWASGNFSASS
jgi:hypothetical protein